MQAEQLLCWSGMKDTEQSTTFGSNEESKKFTVEYIVIKTSPKNSTFSAFAIT